MRGVSKARAWHKYWVDMIYRGSVLRRERRDRNKVEQGEKLSKRVVSAEVSFNLIPWEALEHELYGRVGPSWRLEDWPCATPCQSLIGCGLPWVCWGCNIPGQMAPGLAEQHSEGDSSEPLTTNTPSCWGWSTGLVKAPAWYQWCSHRKDDVDYFSHHVIYSAYLCIG